MCKCSNSACGRRCPAIALPHISGSTLRKPDDPIAPLRRQPDKTKGSTMSIQTSIVRDPSTEEFDTRTLLSKARQQAEDRKYEDFMIIDVDAHHYETQSYKEIFNYIEDPVMRD